MTGSRSSTPSIAPRGFAVLGFPANEFGAQEPGTQRGDPGVLPHGLRRRFSDVRQDRRQRRRQASALSVPDRSRSRRREFPAGTTEKPRAAADAAEIHWNFEKFLIGRDGRIAARFAPDMLPEDARVITTIEAELAK